MTPPKDLKPKGKKLEFNVEVIVVQTSDVKVGKKRYSFDYRIMRNSMIIDRGTYDASHSRSPAYMRKTLNSGYATELVLGREFT